MIFFFKSSNITKEGIDHKKHLSSPEFVTNIRKRQHPFFIGRRDEIDYIKMFLTKSGETYQPLTLVGMGGVGKTQLSTEFAFIHAADYKVIWWIDAENSESILFEYQNFCKQFGITIIEDSERKLQVKETVFQWMMNHSNWLFIFDNADTEKELLYYIPSMYKGNIIITSRNPDWLNTLPIDPLKADFAREFLIKSTGDSDKINITKLAKELGELPLALEQASAYIKETGISVIGYLERFKRYRKELFELGKALNSEQTVATTFEVSLKMLEGNYSISVFLLEMCSFLSPEKISMNLFYSAGEIHPLINEGNGNITLLEFDRNISILRRYSLIKIEENEIIIHRLVQLIIQDKIISGNKEEMILLVIRFLNSQNDTDEVLRHYLYLYHNYLSLSFIKSLEVLDLVLTVGKHYLKLALFTQAREVIQHAVSISEMFHDEKDDKRFETLSLYANLLIQLGQNDMARNVMKKLLKYSEELNSFTRLEYLDSLLNVEKNDGNYQLAGMYVEQINILIESTDSLSDSLLFGIFNSIGQYYAEIAQYETAVEYYSRSLSINDDTNKNASALTISSIGEVYRALGNFPMARKYYNEAIEIHNLIFGEINPNTSNNLSNIGLSYYQEFNEKEAKFFLEKALEINKQVFREANLSSVRILNNYAMVEEASGNYQNALYMFKESLNTLDQLTSNKCPDHSVAYYNIGGVYQHLMNFKLAEEFISMALKLDIEIYGDNHPEIAKDYGKLGRLYIETGEYKRSSKCTLKSINIYKKNKLTNTNDYFVSMGNYCVSTYYEKKYYRAKELMLKLLDKISTLEGGDSKNIVILVWYPFFEVIKNSSKLADEKDFLNFIITKYDLF